MPKRGRADASTNLLDASTNLFVQQDLTADKKVYRVLAPGPDAQPRGTLSLRLHELKECQAGEYNLSFIRVQWNPRQRNNLYSLWAQIGGEEFVRLGRFSTDNYDHSDFPCTTRWEKDPVTVRIYEGDPDVPEPPNGKRVAKGPK